MYSYVGSDGNWHPADLERLKEWAQRGYVEPYAPVMNTITKQQTRAEAIPELQPIFAARFETIARQNAAAAAAREAASKKTTWFWGSGLAALVLVVTSVISYRAANKPYHHPPFPPKSQRQNAFAEPARAEYLPGPMPEKERQRIYWEIGMTTANAEIAANKRFPLVRLPRNPSRRALARDDARRKRSFAFLIDLEKKNKKQLIKKTKLSQDELDLIFNEGMEKQWPSPYKELPTVVVKSPAPSPF